MSQLPAKQERSNLPVHLPAERRDGGRGPSVFESETAKALDQAMRKSRSQVTFVVGGLMLTLLVLSSIVQVDKAVVADGRLEATGGKLYISPIAASIVRQVKVRNGDIVKKGDVLAELDATISAADLKQVTESIAAGEARLQRLTAERTGKPMDCGHTATSQLMLECSFWRQRQAELQAGLSSFDAQLGAAQANLQQANGDVSQYSKRLQLATNVDSVYAPLAREGYVSRVDAAKTEDSKEEMRRQYEAARKQSESLQKVAANVAAQRNSFIETRRSAIESDIVDTSAKLETDRQTLEKARKQFDLSTLVAPEDAVVLRVGKVSTGAVADRSAGTPDDEALITLAPLNRPLEAELNVRAKDVGFIRVGDKVSLRLAAYSYVLHGSLKGVVRTISEGSFTYTDDNRAVEPYFKVRVTLTETKLRNVPDDFRLIPGLTLDGDILVGKRTVLSYLVEGVLRTGHEAMREPD